MTDNSRTHDEGFDAQLLEKRFAYLDACPPHLLAEVVTFPHGDLPDRVAGIVAWRSALLGGKLPGAETWPPRMIDGPARKALSEMGLARFCRGQDELVDALLVDLMRSFRDRAAVVAGAVLDRLRELEALERAEREAQSAIRGAPGGGPPGPRTDEDAGATGGAGGTEAADAVAGEPDEAARQRLQRQAEAEVAELADQAAADADLLATWGEHARAWTEISEVFGDLGEMAGRGWDLAAGVLKHTGWTNILKLHELVARLPQIRDVVRSLGRLQTSDSDELSVAEQVFEAVQRIDEELREVRTPLAPQETRGIERSDDIARMLPMEAAMLGHPVLRKLWHARRAERALVTYRVEGLEYERVPVETTATEARDVDRPRPERGPILLVLDTSGSMSGRPEQVAKALALEAMRVAHREKRRCYVYVFGSRAEVVEHELALTPGGVGAMLAFLGHSFGGGTDIGALFHALDRLELEDWCKADVVVATDGQWRAPDELVDRVRDATDGGTRFHGVQIGARGPTGLDAVCDPVHVFTDWAQAGGW